VHVVLEQQSLQKPAQITNAGAAFPLRRGAGAKQSGNR
jgi:hypothetical protein